MDKKKLKKLFYEVKVTTFRCDIYSIYVRYALSAYSRDYYRW